jgi:hypothetical protein
MRFPLPRLFGVLALILVSLASAIPSPALAATVCNGPLDGVTIQGNLTVPDGASCTLSGSTVTGNVTVSAGGQFFSGSSTIQGKVSGDSVDEVGLDGGTVVKGSVTVSGAFVRLFLVGVRVNGNVTLSGNATNGPLSVESSTIGGNLTVSGNTSGFGSPAIANNSIGGNLSCEGNVPAPSGGGNAVSGRQTGQCASL